MGVPVSKLKSSSQRVTLIGKKNLALTKSTLDQDDLCNVQLVESRATSYEKSDDHLEEALVETEVTSNKVTTDEQICDQSTGQSLCPLKYIDDNEVSERDSFRKETENDNDSGNASISSDNSHHGDGYEFESAEAPEDIDLASDPIRLRRRPPSAFNFYSTLTNRLSTTSFVKRYSAQSVLSQIEQSSLKKLISKLQPGDLIEMRCLCNCLKSGQLRASLNHRQRFRRTLQRQSFHQMPLTSTAKRSSINLSSVFRRSCISGSVSELPNVSGDSRNLLQTNIPFTSNEQCIEQFHYVLVHKVEPGEETTTVCGDQTSSVLCFHVRPYQRVALLEDDRHLGVIKHESLDAIVGQFLGEMEERHWQFGRGIKQPKLSVFYQIRNQEKLSQSILKQTLNAQPDIGRVIDLLMDVKDSYVRYHRTLCNSEHYATLWKYGIGWSTWANNRADILRALEQFVQSFSQVSPSNSMQLQGGECLLEQTNLIVHCFGLHGSRLEDSIRHWIQSQVVIARTPGISLPLLDESYLQSNGPLLVNDKENEQPLQEQSPDYKSSTSSLEESNQINVELEATKLALIEAEVVTGAVNGQSPDECQQESDPLTIV